MKNSPTSDAKSDANQGAPGAMVVGVGADRGRAAGDQHEHALACA